MEGGELEVSELGKSLVSESGTEVGSLGEMSGVHFEGSSLVEYPCYEYVSGVGASKEILEGKTDRKVGVSSGLCDKVTRL